MHLRSLKRRDIVEIVFAIGMALFVAIKILPSQRNMIMVGFIPILLVLLKYPEIGISFYVSALGLLDIVFSKVGIPSGMQALPIGLLLTILFIRFFFERKGGRVLLGNIPLVVFTFAILLISGLYWSPGEEYARWKATAFVMYNVLVVCCLTLLVREKERLAKIVYFSAVLGGFFLFLGIFSLFYIGSSDGWHQVTMINVGCFDPIWLSRGFGFFALTFLILFHISNASIKKIVFLIFALLLTYLIFRSGARGPGLAIVSTVMFYYGVLFKGSIVKRMGILLAGLLLLFVVYIVSPQEVQDRYKEIIGTRTKQSSITGREGNYRSAYYCFLDNPVVGIGTGGYASYENPSRGMFGVRGGKGYPHNIILEVAAEFGVLGLILLMLFLYLNFRIIFHVAKTHSQITKDNCLLIWGILVFIFDLVNSMVSGDLATNKMLWFGSAFMWTAYVTDSTKTGVENRKSLTLNRIV